MAKGRPVTLVGLDIGTSKTTVLVAEAGGKSPRIIGMGISPSVGLQKGAINDVEAVAKSIGRALEKAEKMAGFKVASAIVSYNGAGVTVMNRRVSHTAGNSMFSCEESDVPLKVMTPAGIPQGNKVLHVIPPRIIPDGFGVAPEPEARVITAETRDITNIVESLRLAGLAVQEIIYGPLAGAEVLLSPAEREFGTLLIDIGAGATSISIFDRGMIRETAVLPVGGEHLVSDLAIGLRTSLARAEEILKSYSLQVQTGEEEMLGLNAGQEENADGVSDGLAGSIIEARITEILNLAAIAVRSFDYPGLLPGGAVLYGGVSLLSGLVPIAESRLRMTVRVGSPDTTEPGLSQDYTNALGLVRYVYTCLGQGDRDRKKYREQNGRLRGRFLNWIQERVKNNNRPLKC